MKRTSIPCPAPSLLSQANAPLQLTDGFLKRFPEARSKSMKPALPGSIQTQYKRCGKGNCYCKSGKQHGPYYYLFFRKNGKLIKRYIRPGELDTVIILVAAMAWRKQNSKVIIEKCKRLRENLKKIKQVFEFSMRLLRPPAPKRKPKPEPKQYGDSMYYKGRLIGAPEVKYQWTMSEYIFCDD